MAIAGVQEQLCSVDRLDKLTRGRQIFQRPLVVFHHVDLERDSRRPGAAELGGWERSAEEQRSLRTWPCLGQLLRRHHSEREPGIDKVARQAFGRTATALRNRLEADLLRVADALVEVGEGVAVVEVGRVDNVSGGAQLVGECKETLRLPLCVMEQQ